MIPPGIPDFFSRRRVLDAGRSRCPGAPGQATPRSRGSRSPSTASGPTRRLPHLSDISPGAAGHLTGTRQRASTNSSAERPTPPERCSPTRRPGTTRGWATTSSSASWSRFPEAKTASRTPAHLSKRRCTRRPRGSSTAPTRRLLGPQPGIRGARAASIAVRGLPGSRSPRPQSRRRNHAFGAHAGEVPACTARHGGVRRTL